MGCPVYCRCTRIYNHQRQKPHYKMPNTLYLLSSWLISVAYLMSSSCHWFTQDEAMSPICVDSGELGTRRLPLHLLIITT